MSDLCVLCDEPIRPHETANPMMTAEGPRRAHRECALRAVVGGIGHWEDHAYWCGQMQDPDGGRTFRQSALEVAARWGG